MAWELDAVQLGQAMTAKQGPATTTEHAQAVMAQHVPEPTRSLYSTSKAATGCIPDGSTNRSGEILPSRTAEEQEESKAVAGAAESYRFKSGDSPRPVCRLSNLFVPHVVLFEAIRRSSFLGGPQPPEVVYCSSEQRASE